jgi:hypothetical protein
MSSLIEFKPGIQLSFQIGEMLPFSRPDAGRFVIAKKTDAGPTSKPYPFPQFPAELHPRLPPFSRADAPLTAVGVLAQIWWYDGGRGGQLGGRSTDGESESGEPWRVPRA